MIPLTTKNLAAVLTPFFGLFIVASQPHRVHHFFDQHAVVAHQPVHHRDNAAGRHRHDDNHGAPAKAPDCALQNSAEQAHAALLVSSVCAIHRRIWTDRDLLDILVASNLHAANMRPRAPPPSFQSAPKQNSI